MANLLQSAFEWADLEDTDLDDNADVPVCGADASVQRGCPVETTFGRGPSARPSVRGRMHCDLL